MATTEGKIVVCPQCGKKYKLKEGFEAASFTCNGCSATVWVKKPRKSSGPTSKRAGSGRAGGGSRRGSRGGKRGAPALKARGRAHRGEAVMDDGEGHRQYVHKKDNSTAIVLALLGIVVVGGIIFFVVSKGDDKDKTAQAPPSNVGATDDGGGCGSTDPDGSSAGGTNKKTDGGTGDGQPAKAAGDGEPVKEVGDGEATDRKPIKKMGGASRQGAKKGTSRWDPPADLGHLEDTPPEMRKKIDELIKTMMDYELGRESLDAKEALAAIGKPAFPRILGSMAKIRDSITDTNSHEEKRIESSLKLADGCLREMDGWLTAKHKSTLRPGSERKFIRYILRLHYKRWVQTLSKMPEMPGPFDPTQEYGGDAPEEYK